jgi:hypothetical protein
VLALPTFKQAFIRHDVLHSGIWFLAAAIALVAVSWRRDRRAEAALGLVCVLVALSPARVTRDRLNPFRSADAAVDQVRTLASPDRLSHRADFRANLRNVYRIDQRILDLVRGRTVHIHAHETSVAWAYPHMRWKPLPAFQSYTTYTSRLDRLNATTLSSDGPDFVLNEADAATDGRHFTLEAPETMLTMFCRYKPVATVGSWQLLKRRENRCGDARLLRTVRTRIGEHVAVPSGSGRGMVVMDLHELPTSAWERLRTFLFRRKDLYTVVNRESIFRMVPGTADGLTIVRIPDELDYPGIFGLSVDANSIAYFENWRSATRGPPLTVDFYEVPIASKT